MHQNMLNYFQQHRSSGGTPPTKEQQSETDASTAQGYLNNGPDVAQHFTEGEAPLPQVNVNPAAFDARFGPRAPPLRAPTSRTGVP